MSADYSQLPEDLPEPRDDGAADGLLERSLPDLALPSTQGGELRLPGLASDLLVAYVYPMTGTPGVPLPHGWDDIPGARGCTPQSCAYRDALAEFDGSAPPWSGSAPRPPPSRPSSLLVSTSPSRC